MYYEEDVARECSKKLTIEIENNRLYNELVFINDGSKDKTPDILQELALTDKKVKVINFSRNFGHQASVTEGIEIVKGNAIVIIDEDLQNPPELIKDMLVLWKQGYEVAYAKKKKEMVKNR
jgi:polyisoprenyl-phosphate glycosyltransferase